MTILSIILTIALPVGLLGLFLLLSKINRNTPAPEGTVMPECKGCADLTCGQNDVYKEAKVKVSKKSNKGAK